MNLTILPLNTKSARGIKNIIFQFYYRWLCDRLKLYFNIFPIFYLDNLMYHRFHPWLFFIGIFSNFSLLTVLNGWHLIILRLTNFCVFMFLRFDCTFSYLYNAKFLSMITLVTMYMLMAMWFIGTIIMLMAIMIMFMRLMIVLMGIMVVYMPIFMFMRIMVILLFTVIMTMVICMAMSVM